MTYTPPVPQAFPGGPIVNPDIGGFGMAYDYISLSQYQFAPTAQDTTQLVPGQNTDAQTQALADTIRRATGVADQFCFGADPSGKGASLAATLSVEQARVKVLQGELRLVCRYRPIVQLNGLSVGYSPNNLLPLPSQLLANITFGLKVITAPFVMSLWQSTASTFYPGAIPGRTGRFYALWSYVNGYAHSVLAEDADAASNTVVLEPTDGNGGLFAVFPGSQLRICDGSQTEWFTVASVSGSTITTVDALRYSHTVPEAPDFLPVTSIPSAVEEAMILLTTALIKTRGDNSIELSMLADPSSVSKEAADGAAGDVGMAYDLLQPYQVAVRQKA